jgi:glycosyltransferase involved in cell wall biosynthesis
MVMKLGVAMIVKNEEAVLARCLDSLEGIDEIVILDTGSSDNTRDVAQKYTDKYFEGVYTWNDNFAEARNKARELSTADWILHIDADEWLEEGGLEKARKAIEAHPNAKALDVTATSAHKESSNIKPRLSRNLPEVKMIGAS